MEQLEVTYEEWVKHLKSINSPPELISKHHEEELYKVEYGLVKYFIIWYGRKSNRVFKSYQVARMWMG